MKKNLPVLEFSQKYDSNHAKKYFEKHRRGFWRRVSNWRDHQLARRALVAAGNPTTVLDIPCGAGRFWDVLTEESTRTVYASDYSRDMIDTGLNYRSPNITARIARTFQASAFDLPVENDFVECVFCMRLLHHIGEKQDRFALLSELHRVTSDTLIISLWLDGNYQAWRRACHQARRTRRTFQNRFVLSARVVEQEFEGAGFDIVERLDFARFYSMWRVYVLHKRAKNDKNNG